MNGLASTTGLSTREADVEEAEERTVLTPVRSSAQHESGESGVKHVAAKLAVTLRVTGTTAQETCLTMSPSARSTFPFDGPDYQVGAPPHASRGLHLRSGQHSFTKGDVVDDPRIEMMAMLITAGRMTMRSTTTSSFTNDRCTEPWTRDEPVMEQIPRCTGPEGCSRSLPTRFVADPASHFSWALRSWRGKVLDSFGTIRVRPTPRRESLSGDLSLRHRRIEC
jgi:hypothetical protein